LPAPLQGALHSLYANYQKAFERWDDAGADGSTPPVFIVVCNNTNVSKLVYDYVSGSRRRIRMDHRRSFPVLSASSRMNTLEGGHIDQ